MYFLNLPHANGADLGRYPVHVYFLFYLSFFMYFLNLPNANGAELGRYPVHVYFLFYLSFFNVFFEPATRQRRRTWSLSSSPAIVGVCLAVSLG
jgi:hypothetical protein